MAGKSRLSTASRLASNVIRRTWHGEATRSRFGLAIASGEIKVPKKAARPVAKILKREEFAGVLTPREIEEFKILPEGEKDIVRRHSEIQGYRTRMLESTVRILSGNKKITIKKISGALMGMPHKQAMLVSYFLGGGAASEGSSRRAIRAKVSKEQVSKDLGIPVKDIDRQMVPAVEGFCKRLKIPVFNELRAQVDAQRYPPKWKRKQRKNKRP